MVNVNSIVQHEIQIKNGIMKLCQCEFKIDHKCKKDYSWTPSTCICENSKYLKRFADTSVTAFDDIISVMKIVSTTKTKIDCYILHTVLLVIILLLIITIICYHYANYHSPKQEGFDALTIKNEK